MKKFLLATSSVVMMASIVLAQKPARTVSGNEGMYPALVEFEPTSAPAFTKGQVFLATDARTAAARTASAKFITFENDKLGFEHHRYQQTFNDIPVEHATYIMHVNKGKVLVQNGHWIKDFPSTLTAKASLTETAALAAALKSIGAKSYKWESAAEEAFLKNESGDPKATFFPTGKLVYYAGEQEIVPSKLRLAYKFDIYASTPLSRQIMFVDAQTGAVLGQRELIHTVDAPGTAVTGFSGTQSITTDNTGSGYRLRETGRGKGIQTLNMKNAGTSYAAAVDFTDADNNWNNVNADKDQYATDAHWGTERTYDYFLTKFNRNSIDGAGFALKNYVHANLVAFGYPNNVNAFWDGSRMTYGDGSSTVKPLTALDVIGHEIVHGLTSNTADLVYSGESGAMNEAFSDIFGTAIEFYSKTGNWSVGEDMGLVIRSMSNPNSYGDPDTYQGTNWYTGSADYGGVHTNSGVLNYWFYLLSVGGSGTNDKGTAYSVTGIGIDKAAAIAFRTLTVYMVSTSKYADGRTLSIKAAQDLYGVGSEEVTQVTNAWNAVGVGGTITPPACTDNYEANESRTAAKTIVLNQDLTAKIGSSTDKDWYKFTTTSSAPKVKITVTNLPADYDLKLYNSAGTQLAVSEKAGTSSETITYNTPTAGATYYIQIYGYNGASSNSCYTFRTSTSATNLFNEATTDDNGVNGLVKITLDEPLSIYPVPATDKLTLQFDEKNSGQKQLQLVDLRGRVVFKHMLTYATGTNRLEINLPKLHAGIYMLKVGESRIYKVQIAE